MSCGLGGPPAPATSSLVMTMGLTPAATAATASLTLLMSASGRLPAKMMALGALRAPASAVALLPRPEAGGVARLPDEMAGSSARAVSTSRETWTTVLRCQLSVPRAIWE